jgi:hypothetical protein
MGDGGSAAGYTHDGAVQHKGAPAVHVTKKTRLVLYPYEWDDPRGKKTMYEDKTGNVFALPTTYGHLYVYDGSSSDPIANFKVAAGPTKVIDQGKHKATPTYAGLYTLGAREHHITPGWPMSTVPWGAPLELRTSRGDTVAVPQIYDKGKRNFTATQPFAVDKAIYANGKKLTGKGGLIQDDLAYILFAIKNRPTPTGDGRTYTLDVTDFALLPDYRANDFGQWAWGLNPLPSRKGEKSVSERSGYYIHTTPNDEKAWDPPAEETYRTKKRMPLENSHGCIHVQPEDRDKMMDPSNGYLTVAAGVTIEVKGYGEKGPNADDDHDDD